MRRSTDRDVIGRAMTVMQLHSQPHALAPALALLAYAGSLMALYAGAVCEARRPGESQYESAGCSEMIGREGFFTADVVTEE